MRRDSVALLLIQIAVGYEWVVSGLSKLANGDFPGGLSTRLAGMGKHAPDWYRGFLAGAVEPHARLFGYGIETSELVAGIVLVSAAFVLLHDGGRLQRGLQLASGAAALVGIVLAVNFELANGGSFGLKLASDSFDEGVDLDTILIGLQLALVVFGAAALPRRSRLRAPEDWRSPLAGASR